MYIKSYLRVLWTCARAPGLLVPVLDKCRLERLGLGHLQSHQSHGNQNEALRLLATAQNTQQILESKVSEISLSNMIKYSHYKSP